MDFALRPGPNPLAPASADKRLLGALAASFLVHLVLVLGIAITPPTARKQNDAGRSLDVVLVNSKTAARPTQADALAQANLDGGGNTDAPRQAKTPLPAQRQEHDDPAVAKKLQQVKALEEEAKRLATQVNADRAVESKSSRKTRPSPNLSAADLIQNSLEAARLQAQIDREMEAYQKRPRRAFVGARTREYTFARYVEDWRLKVEKVGNLNYPEEAKRQKLYGSLRLTVSIRADGSLEKVEINQPSGHPALDEAAIRIVRLAAPYAPFSEEMRQKVDVLGITRTWTFTRADQLTSGE